MIKTEVLSVRNPRWTSEDHSAIDCLVRTNTLVGEVPFTASMHDPELHGRETYARCLAGEFGEIAPMEPRNAPVLLAHVAHPPEYQRLERFLLEANKENNRKSFRSVAIVWASLLDNLLNELLEGDAIRVAATGQLVGKPPRKFGSRIKKALERGLIDQEDADKCDYIRCIRNAAAHDWELSLESEDILPSLRRLHEADHARVLVFHEDLEFLIQQVYVASCSMLVMRFVGRLP
jgi:hypothetical protein